MGLYDMEIDGLLGLVPDAESDQIDLIDGVVDELGLIGLNHYFSFYILNHLIGNM